MRIREPWARVPLLLLVGAALTSVAAQDADPLVGVWTLDAARSHRRGAPMPRSQTITFTQGDRGLEVVNAIVDPAGTPLSGRLSLTFDGRDYPVADSEVVDAASEVRVDAFTTVRTEKKGGSIVRWVTRAVSSDRATLIVTVDVAENGSPRRASTTLLVRQQ